MTQICGPVLPTKKFAESKVLKKGDQQIPTDLHMTHTGRCNVYMAGVNWNSRFSVMAVQNPTPNLHPEIALVRSRAWEPPRGGREVVTWTRGMGIHCNAHINNLVVKSEVFQRRLVPFWKNIWLSWLVGTSTNGIVNHSDMYLNVNIGFNPLGWRSWCV